MIDISIIRQAMVQKMRYRRYCPINHALGQTRGMSLGERIKAARAKMGLSQRGLAKLVGINQATLSAIENGHTENPGIGLVQRLGQVLNIPVEVLTHGPRKGESEEMRRLKEQLSDIIAELNPLMRALLLKQARTLLESQQEVEAEAAAATEPDSPRQDTKRH